MFTLPDKPGHKDVWASLSDDNTTILYDDDTEKPFTCADVLCTRGKYEGFKLSEIDDASYLKWVYGANLADPFILAVVGIRLNELKVD